MAWELLIWAGKAIVILIVVAALIEAWTKRHKSRRLVDMRPDADTLRKRPWEADGVTKVNDPDRVLNQNRQSKSRWIAHRRK
ncbi:hypothetical protein SAMN05444279_10685 [Ruegeria intermedia]|uniref:Uncharacterized protein n=1 Tax=Ruegeria intermedia TaxID=996115 RepID=A0A1M4VIP9_9RHOB|nr:hypothetical protein [Ruegeria intermedia]SHE68839.1 hypothetical protein SAMN05444279_10685 [Ruegeria intermedia]